MKAVFFHPHHPDILLKVETNAVPSLPLLLTGIVGVASKQNVLKGSLVIELLKLRPTLHHPNLHQHQALRDLPNPDPQNHLPFPQPHYAILPTLPFLHSIPQSPSHLTHSLYHSLPRNPRRKPLLLPLTRRRFEQPRQVQPRRQRYYIERGHAFQHVVFAAIAR